MSDDDDTLDPRDVALMRKVVHALRSGPARQLLAGNDTGCFTTEQYRAAYERRFCRDCNINRVPDALWVYMTPEDHLRSIPDVVREVAPGVWAGVT